MSTAAFTAGILVAIDGPAGSGKSTVSKRVAQQLDIGYLDTGAMYRALTWKALEEGLDLDDHDAVREVADRLDLSMNASLTNPQVFVGGVEVTAAIRTPRIAENVAAVARNLQVRAWMAKEQHRLMLDARERGLGMVAEGRDITTVVCPEADVRVLLLANEEARLRRRTLELHGAVTEETLAATRAQIVDRDKSDATVSEFFEPARGVVAIDSSNLGIDDVVAAVISLARTRIPWAAGNWTTTPEDAVDLPGGGLRVTAKQGSDAWRNTYYGFVHDTEHALLRAWDGAEGMAVAFTLDYDRQFDQAGIMVRASETEWIKAGVEYSDGIPQVGAVVTHENSDWSLAPVPEWMGRRVTIQATRHRNAILIRARADEEPFRLVRVAFMPEDVELQAGPHLAAPSRTGLEVEFLSWERTDPESGIH